MRVPIEIQPMQVIKEALLSAGYCIPLRIQLVEIHSDTAGPEGKASVAFASCLWCCLRSWLLGVSAGEIGLRADCTSHAALLPSDLYQRHLEARWERSHVCRQQLVCAGFFARSWAYDSVARNMLARQRRYSNQRSFVSADK